MEQPLRGERWRVASQLARAPAAALLLPACLAVLACKRDPERTAAPPTAKRAPPSMPTGHDVALAKLLDRGAPGCEVYLGGAFESCPDADAISAHVAGLVGAPAADAVATCVERLDRPDVRVRLLAAHCVDSSPAALVTPYLANGLAVAAQESDHDALAATCRAFGKADAQAAKLEADVIALIGELRARPGLPTTGPIVGLADALFHTIDGRAIAGGARTQAWAVEALIDQRADHVAAVLHLSGITDKAAMCAAVTRHVDLGHDWLDATTQVLGTHECDSVAPALFAALLKRVPRDPNSYLVTALRMLDARADLPPALRAAAATALEARHRGDAHAMADGPNAQAFLAEFRDGAAYFAGPRPATLP